MIKVKNRRTFYRSILEVVGKSIGISEPDNETENFLITL